MQPDPHIRLGTNASKKQHSRMRHVTAAGQQPKRSCSTTHAKLGRHINTLDHTSNSRAPTDSRRRKQKRIQNRKEATIKQTHLNSQAAYSGSAEPSQRPPQRTAPSALARRQNGTGRRSTLQWHRTARCLAAAARTCVRTPSHALGDVCGAGRGGRRGGRGKRGRRAARGNGARAYRLSTSTHTHTHTHTHAHGKHRRRRVRARDGVATNSQDRCTAGHVIGGCRRRRALPGGVLVAERCVGAAGGRRRSRGHKPGGLFAKAPTAPYWILQL